MKRGVFLPDQHYRYQHQKAINLIKKVVADLKPDYFVNLGDALDFPQISAFDKDPANIFRVDHDMDLFKKDLQEFDKILPKNCVKVFCEGNHEHRLQTYIAKRCPEIFKLVKSVREYCEFDKLGWKYIPHGVRFKIGALKLFHGTIFGSNVPSKMNKRYASSTVQGHDHGAGIQWDRVDGKSIVSVNGGHLSREEKAKYLKDGICNWQLGFTIAYFSENLQEIYPVFVPIFGDGTRCIVEGKLYSV